jgi:hypothetical protein
MRIIVAGGLGTGDSLNSHNKWSCLVAKKIF